MRLVLVSPRTAGNVGACARLVANFGIEEWIIVAPQCNWENWEARKLATGGAGQELDHIRIVDTVEEAIIDCQAAIGFSRRIGKSRVLSLDLGAAAELGATLESVALVFGNEETGLTRDELRACTHLCLIPTEPALASMNLSHAVAVAVARFYESAQSERRQTKRPLLARPAMPARLAELSAMMAHWREFLIDAGMDRGGNPDRILVTLRQIFERGALTAQEIRALRGVLSKAQVKLGTRRRGKRVPEI